VAVAAGKVVAADTIKEAATPAEVAEGEAAAAGDDVANDNPGPTTVTHASRQ